MNPLATVYSASHNESICALYYLCFKKLSISFRCHFVQMCAQSRRQPIETAICFMIVLKQLVYRGFGCCFRVGTTFTVIANEWNWTEEAEKTTKTEIVNVICERMEISVRINSWNHLNCKHMVHISLFIEKRREWFRCNCILFRLHRTQTHECLV